MIDAVIIKMRGYRALHIVGRVLDRGEGIDLLPVGKHDDASRMLSRRSPYLSAAYGKSLDLSPLHIRDLMILIVALYISIGGLELHGAYGPCLEGLSLSEDLLCIGMGLGLIISGKVKVYIRLLVALEAKKGLKGDIKAILYKGFSADGADSVRHVAARLV